MLRDVLWFGDAELAADLLALRQIFRIAELPQGTLADSKLFGQRPVADAFRFVPRDTLSGSCIR